jgi:hypothetical protein
VRDARGPLGHDARSGALPGRAGDVLAGAEPSQADDLIEIAHALANLGPRDERARRAWGGIAARGEALVDAFGATQVRKMAWACSKTPMRSAAFMARLVAPVLRSVAHLDGNAIVWLLHPFAKAGVDVPSLYAAIAQRAEARAGTLDVQGLAITAWSFATAGGCELDG